MPELIEEVNARLCLVCEVVKPFAELQVDKRLPLGVARRCKACEKSRKMLRLKYSKVDRSQYFKDYFASERGKQAHRRNGKMVREKFPKELKAIRQVRAAVTSGKLERLPCVVCGDTKVQGHHYDYDYPLSVVWLCKRHHVDTHMVLDRIKELRNLTADKEQVALQNKTNDGGRDGGL